MSLSWKAGLAGIVVLSAATYVAAQMTSDQHGMPTAMTPGMSMDHLGSAAGQPKLPGQDTFGAIHEIVGILEADPNTDWSKVDIAALREHLIDMNEVTLHAAAAEKKLADGVDIAITGEGRTLEAIRRMVPAQARQLNGMNGWSVRTEEMQNGARLLVTTSDPRQVARLQALGFIGLMAEGSHHQPHHLMMARGEMVE